MWPLPTASMPKVLLIAQTKVCVSVGVKTTMM
jgi:hypothetical protein